MTPSWSNTASLALLFASSTALAVALSARLASVTLPLALGATATTLLLMAGFSVGPGRDESASGGAPGAAGAFLAAAVALLSSLLLVVLAPAQLVENQPGPVVLGAALSLALSDCLMFGLAWALRAPASRPFGGEQPLPLSGPTTAEERGVVAVALQAMLAPLFLLLLGLDRAQDWAAGRRHEHPHRRHSYLLTPPSSPTAREAGDPGPSSLAWGSPPEATGAPAPGGGEEGAIA